MAVSSFPDVALISPLPSYFLSSSNNFTQISRCTLKSEVLDIFITENTKSGLIYFVFLVHPYGSEILKTGCGTSVAHQHNVKRRVWVIVLHWVGRDRCSICFRQLGFQIFPYFHFNTFTFIAQNWKLRPNDPQFSTLLWRLLTSSKNRF